MLRKFNNTNEHTKRYPARIWVKILHQYYGFKQGKFTESDC